MSAAVPKCATCGRPVVEGFKPFCSKRCADIDLGRWFSGSYAIAGSRIDEADDNGEAIRPGERDDADDER